MISNNDAERCRSFIHSQLNTAKTARTTQPKLAITLSRETGTGGRVIAQQLAAYLQPRGPNRECPWTVFDRNLVAKVIEDHQLPKELARYMPEDRVSQLDDMVEESFGLHPSAWTLVQHIAQTMLKLAELGNVIIVGRGANLVASRLPHVFHVRLVGTLERRIERFCQFEKLNPKSAREIILTSDQARARYVLQHFRKRIDDPLLYDLVVNTDRFNDEQAASLAGDAALGFCARVTTKSTLATAA